MVFGYNILHWVNVWGSLTMSSTPLTLILYPAGNELWFHVKGLEGLSILLFDIKACIALRYW